MVESSVQSTLISDGYAAFNSDDWETVEALFCADTPPENPEFPLWWDEDDGELKGRAAVFAKLRDLRQGKVKAKLLAVADHGHHAVTLDISTGGAGPHACADEVEFDESGLIKVFRHCVAGHHAQAGSTSHKD